MDEKTIARLHRGDCLQYLQSLPESYFSALMSDPPYAVGFKNDIYDDSKEKIDDMIPKWFAEWFRILQPNAYAFLYVGVKNINQWIDVGITAGFDYRNMLATRAFNRGACAPKGNFVFEFQPILVFSKGKGKTFNEVDFFKQSEEWFKDRRNKNPREYTYAYSNWIPSELCYGTETFGSNKKAPGEIHPNAKSVKMEQFLIEISTQPGEWVLDPFLGSGTTGVAALQCGRNFVGCEMNDKWYEKSKDRIGECNALFSTVEEV